MNAKTQRLAKDAKGSARAATSDPHEEHRLCGELR